jgi:hypothetical protein
LLAEKGCSSASDLHLPEFMQELPKNVQIKLEFKDVLSGKATRDDAERVAVGALSYWFYGLDLMVL